MELHNRMGLKMYPFPFLSDIVNSNGGKCLIRLIPTMTVGLMLAS
jgi:hypothetical protein